MPLEIINKIVMMSVPKYEYMQQLKVSINILNSKKNYIIFKIKKKHIIILLTISVGRKHYTHILILKEINTQIYIINFII